jgi:hypothetical protein
MEQNVFATLIITISMEHAFNAIQVNYGTAISALKLLPKLPHLYPQPLTAIKELILINHQ